MRVFLQRYALHLAFSLALVATLTSMYFSEILHWEPCRLCWYQRIFMYPLTLLFGIAAVRRDVHIWVYTLPLSLMGAAIALYHYLIQKTTFIPDIVPCTATAPCTKTEIDVFGFITIPFLSLVTFLTITLLLFFLRRVQSKPL